jgi:hypothetical protein
MRPHDDGSRSDDIVDRNPHLTHVRDVGDRIEKAWGILPGSGARIQHCRKWIEVEPNGRSGILAVISVLRRDDRYGIADVANLVGAQGWTPHRFRSLGSRGQAHGRHRQGGRSPYAEDSRQVASSRDVASDQSGMGEGTADEHHINDPGRGDIRYEGPATAQQGVVLEARNGDSYETVAPRYPSLQVRYSRRFRSRSPTGSRSDAIVCGGIL